MVLRYRLDQITVYPIKSCKGSDLGRTSLDKFGLEYDRRFMLVDEHGLMLTQRKAKGLHLLKAWVAQGALYIERQGAETLILALPVRGNEHSIKCWDDPCRSIDCGDEVAAALSETLGQSVRLYAIHQEERRVVAGSDAITSYTDGYPLLLIGSASLDDLNARLVSPVPMHRFRPNLVVQTDQAFIEDEWQRIRIGSIEFDMVKACKRCVFTCVDQNDGSRGAEPLKTLAGYRRFGDEIRFGMNVIHRGLGEISIGQDIEVLA